MFFSILVCVFFSFVRPISFSHSPHYSWRFSGFYKARECHAVASR
jgi:hypothetical protein